MSRAPQKSDGTWMVQRKPPLDVKLLATDGSDEQL